MTAGNQTSNRTGSALAIIAVLFLCGARLVYSLGMDIHPDEAYYWTWSRILDFSYNDQGPGIALYIALFTKIFGHTTFALKLGAAVAAALALISIYFTAKEMWLGEIRAWLALSLMALIPGFFGGALLLLHDSVLMVCWCAGLYFLVRFLRRREWVAFYLVFVFLGLGVLGKYTMVFFAISIVILFFCERSVRPLIKTVHFWIAVLIGAALTAPIVIWNVRNDWEGIDAIIHLRSAGGANFAEVTTGLYLAGQLLTFSPIWLLLFVLIILVGLYRWFGGLWRRWKDEGFAPGRLLTRWREALSPHEFFRAVEEPDEATRQFVRGRAIVRFVIIQSLILPVYFLLFSLENTVQANWVFPSYSAMVLVIAANRIEFKDRGRRLVYDGMLAVGLLFVLVFDFFILFSGPLVARLPGNIDPFWIPENRVRGFREVITAVEAEGRRKDPSALFAANRYQDAAIASWYLSGQPYVPSINILQKNQYSFWPGLVPGRNYIVFAVQENTCEKAALFWGPILESMFEEVEEFPEGEVKVDGAVVKRYNLFYAKNFKYEWDALLVEYLTSKIILDFMPNLKGKFVGLASKEGQRSVSDAMSKMYLSKKGKAAGECSVF